MRITFVLPLYLKHPAGGFKVVYEYANRLQARGHQVTLVHPREVEPQTRWAEQFKEQLWPYRVKLRDRRLVPWFKLHEEIHVKLVTDLREQFIPPGDAIVATAYNTAPWVASYAADKGRKFYLIQHYETWDGAQAEVERTWRLPLHKIVIAKWLRQLAQNFGEAARVTYIPNGLDFTHFKITTRLATRPLRVGMLAHPEFAWKGTADGLAALELARQQVPELQVILFGTHPRPADLPAWIEYLQKPNAEQLLALYNSCAVFLHPSWAEGWPLPPAEALACGCALVAAANPGVLDYAEDGVTALTAPIQQPAALAQALLAVLKNADLRLRLAEAGHAQIQQYTWERATLAFEAALQTAPTMRAVSN